MTEEFFPYRMAGVDLDGTLLGPEKQLSPENAAAIFVLQEMGVRVVLASGRRHESMLALHRELGLDTPLVSCQGALVKQARSGRVLYEQNVPEDLAAEVVDLAASSSSGSLLYFHRDAIYVAREDRFTDVFKNRGRHRLTECGDLTLLAGSSPQKLVWVDVPERTTARLAALRARYQGRLELTITSPDYLEFTASGVNKAEALAAVAASYGVDASEVMVFGDGNNDVPMFCWAGLSVAMSSATAQAKSAASHVAPAGDPRTSFSRAVALALATSPVLRELARQA